MKKTILIFAFMGMAAGLYAGPVSPEKALQVAERVLSVQSTKASGDIRIIWDGESAATKADVQDPAFYVVGRDGGGFVIVSGNDNVRPVLALSYTNRFQVEGMPCNVSAWMERIKRYSRSATEASPEVKAQWEALEQTKGDLLPEDGITGIYFPGNKRTVEWDQDEPGSSLLPTASNDTEHAISGCVAIAVAQIMTWFKYPAAGQGTVSGYNSSINNHYVSVPEHTLGEATEDWDGTYDWEGMEELTDYQKFRAAKGTPLEKDIAHLVYDIGTLLQLQYSADATGGNVDRIASQFSEHMGYSKKAYERLREDGYPAWKWDEMLVEEVTRHPLYYSGDDPYEKVGHAYVLDGYGFYQGNVVFHFNFGWSGLCNGFYSSDYQAPADDPNITDAGYGEYHNVSALFDFEPDRDGSSSFLMSLGYNSNGGIQASWNQNGLAITIRRLANRGNADFIGSYALFYVDKDDNSEEVDGSRQGVSQGDLSPGYYYTEFSYTFRNPQGLVLGDRFYMGYKPTGEDSFSKVEYISPAIVLDEAPVYPATFIKTESSYNVNDYFYFRLTNHDSTYKNAVWTITDPSKETTVYNQADDRFKLTKAGKYKIKVTPRQGGETVVAVITVN